MFETLIQGGRMEDTDESTELWRHPIKSILTLLKLIQLRLN